MPEMDGLQTPPIFGKRKRKGEHIPIVAMTAHAMKVIESVPQRRYQSIHLKPITAEKFGEVIEEALQIPQAAAVILPRPERRKNGRRTLSRFGGDAKC